MIDVSFDKIRATDSEAMHTVELTQMRLRVELETCIAALLGDIQHERISR